MIPATEGEVKIGAQPTGRSSSVTAAVITLHVQDGVGGDGDAVGVGEDRPVVVAIHALVRDDGQRGAGGAGDVGVGQAAVGADLPLHRRRGEARGGRRERGGVALGHRDVARVEGHLRRGGGGHGQRGGAVGGGAEVRGTRVGVSDRVAAQLQRGGGEAHREIAKVFQPRLLSHPVDRDVHQGPRGRVGGGIGVGEAARQGGRGRAHRDGRRAGQVAERRRGLVDGVGGQEGGVAVVGVSAGEGRQYLVRARVGPPAGRAFVGERKGAGDRRHAVRADGRGRGRLGLAVVGGRGGVQRHRRRGQRGVGGDV